MCARATLTRKQLREVAEELDAELSEEDSRLYRPRFNAAPSETLWLLRHAADRRVVMPAAWGYVVNGRSLINVRGERVGSGGGFREAFASRRCGVICDGFFEWNKRHEPTWFHRADGGLIVLGGLYQRAAGRGRDATVHHPDHAPEFPRRRGARPDAPGAAVRSDRRLADR